MPLAARSSGFLVGVDEDAAAEAARRAGVVVRLSVRTGDAVVTGTPMAHAWATGSSGRVDTDELEEARDDAVRLHFERSASRDVAYGLRTFIDIAVRAPSPGIDDPTTAVHALSHASALLGELAVRPAEDRAIRDADGVVRVVLPTWELPHPVQSVLEEPLRGRGVDDLVRGYADGVADSAVRTSGVSAEEGQAWRKQVAQALAGRRRRGRCDLVTLPSRGRSHLPDGGDAGKTAPVSRTPVGVPPPWGPCPVRRRHRPTATT